MDRDEAVDVVLARLGAKRSAWNGADVRGEVERWITATGLVTSAAVRLELAEDLTARTVNRCTSLLTRDDVPDHVRALTSPQVLAVEADLIARLSHRAGQPVGLTTRLPKRLTDLPCAPGAEGLDTAQADGVAALAGDAALLVVEGAAGSGKTRTLAATREALAIQGRRLVVVTPTLKAARVAGQEVGTEAFSAAWLVHQHGWRWDSDGRWTRHLARDSAPGPDPAATLRRGDLLVVDEAGMLDQDTALALLTVADETGARVALMGDRHQLPAVGRGGVLDHALRWATDSQQLRLDVVHRFSDPEYAALTLAMRTGTIPDLPSDRPSTDSDRSPSSTPSEALIAPDRAHAAVCSALWARGDLRIHATDADRLDALADEAVTGITAAGRRQPVLVMADTHEQVTALNAAIRDRLVATGVVDDRQVVTTHAGARLGVGDRVTTRRNDRDLDVANRDTWTITGLADDGGLTVTGRTGTRHLPAAYVSNQVELAYATTIYGAQGETVGTAHLVLGEHTTGAAVYVGMTRGRDHNTVHVLAETYDEARDQWVAAFHRNPADLGPAHAARQAAEDLERYGPLRPLRPLPAALQQLRAGWDTEHELGRKLRSTTAQRDWYAAHGHVTADRVAEIDADLRTLQARLTQVRQQLRATLREPALQALPADRLTTEHRSWRDQREAAVLATRLRQQQPPRDRRSQIPAPPYQRGPDRGHGIGL